MVATPAGVQDALILDICEFEQLQQRIIELILAVDSEDQSSDLPSYQFALLLSRVDSTCKTLQHVVQGQMLATAANSIVSRQPQPLFETTDQHHSLLNSPQP